MYKGVKRALDITFSIVGTAVTSPILLAVAAAVKLDSKGPVIFKQERLGKDGKTFEMYKFRSMRVNVQQETGWSTDCDPRKTHFGSFIRKFSLDELPQLFNILKGDMSFIGPRPELLRYTMRYTPEEQCILWVRPGISDPSSIRLINLDELVGHDDPEGCYETKILDEKNRMRVAYARSQSFGLDAKVFWDTLLCVLKKNLKREPSARREMPARQGGNR